MRPSAGEIGNAVPGLARPGPIHPTPPERTAVIIRDVEFVGAIGRPGQKAPDTLPQIAFAGRSNVGKSSLVNRLLGRTRNRVARVSATPGKTQEINFYRVDALRGENRPANFLLVDLPGYGYARVPLELRGRWKPLIEGYLRRNEHLLGVVQLIDARHGPSAEDLQMIDFLAEIGAPTLFVLTKIDKLGRQERKRTLPKVIGKLGVDEDQVIPFSSETGEGREDLLASLDALLGEAETTAQEAT